MSESSLREHRFAGIVFVGDCASVSERDLTAQWLPSLGAMSDRLNRAYLQVEQSPAKVTIVKGESVLPTIELNGIKVVKASEAKGPNLGLPQ